MKTSLASRTSSHGISPKRLADGFREFVRCVKPWRRNPKWASCVQDLACPIVVRSAWEATSYSSGRRVMGLRLHASYMVAEICETSSASTGGSGVIGTRACRRNAGSITLHIAARASSNARRRACETRRRGVLRFYDRALGGLLPEVGQTHQFERIGVPLGEEVVDFGLTMVVTGPPRVVPEAVCGSTDGVAEITRVGFHNA